METIKHLETNTANHVTRELGAAFRLSKKKELGFEYIFGPYEYPIIMMAERFGKQGHSGSSAYAVAPMLWGEIRKFCTGTSAAENLSGMMTEPFIPELETIAATFQKLHGKQSFKEQSKLANKLGEGICNLMLQKTVAPILGDDKEWMDVTEMNDGTVLYQNKRNSAVFKDHNGAWYLDAIKFLDQATEGSEDPMYWNTKPLLPDGRRIGNAQYIKSFPFTPKSFTVKFRFEEIEKDGWESHLDDVSQLDPVFEYYNPMYIKAIDNGEAKEV